MGSGSFDPQAYRSFAASTAHQTQAQVFSSREIHKDLDPNGVKIRESRDSEDNPESTPIIIALDVTGSMGMLAEVLARKGLGVLFEEILNEKPVTDPHVMFMAIGDARTDRAPLQVSQFEADNRIVEQLTQIWLEGNGGGNAGESYDLAWYFAARHTEIDSLIKRGQRGYLFTVGDEPAPPGLTQEQIKRFLGEDVEADISPGDILAEAQRKYNVFHVIVEEGGGASYHPLQGWKDLLNERVIRLPDHSKLAEVIVGAIQVSQGGNAPKRFGKVVEEAVKNLPRGKKNAALPAPAIA